MTGRCSTGFKLVVGRRLGVKSDYLIQEMPLRNEPFNSHPRPDPALNPEAGVHIELIDPLIPFYCHIIEITRRGASWYPLATFPPSILIMCMFGYQNSYY